MNERKEKAGDYEITHEIRFGGRTLILGVHPDESAKLPYMTCFKEIDLLYNTVFTDAFASDDYTEVMDIFSERLRNAVRRMKGIRKKRNVPFSVLTAEHCLPDGLKESLSGKLIVLAPSSLAPEYRASDFQLGFAVGGFGCEPGARGRKVFFRELFSGETFEWTAGDVLGVANPAKLPKWAKRKLREYKKMNGGKAS